MRRFARWLPVALAAMLPLAAIQTTFLGRVTSAEAGPNPPPPQSLWTLTGPWVAAQIFNLGFTVPNLLYYPKAYGCNWDGAHDVSTCIQTAINAAVAAGGAQVDLPSGVLPILTVLAPTGSLKMQGRGPSTILRMMPANTGNNPSLLALVNISNVTISDLTFDGAATGAAILGVNGALTGGMTGRIAGTALTLATQPSGAPMSAGLTLYGVGVTAGTTIVSGSGSNWVVTPSQTVGSNIPLYAAPAGSAGGLNHLVQMFHTSNIKYDRVTFQHASGLGINGSGVNTTTITNSRVIDIGNRWWGTLDVNDRFSGISFCCGDSGVSFGLDNTISETFFESIGLDAINSSHNLRFKVLNNQFVMASNQNSLITNNVGASAFYSSIDVGNVVSGNTIHGATGNGLDFPGPRNATISDNIISNSFATGIGIFQSTDVVQFNGTLSSGVLTVNSVSSGTITPNMVLSQGVGADTPIYAPTYIVSGSGNTWQTDGTQTVSGEAMFAGTNARDVAVTGNVLLNNNSGSNMTWTGGVSLGNGAPDHIVVNGNVATNSPGGVLQLYGVSVETKANPQWPVAPTNTLIIGNDLSGNVVAPIADTSTSTSTSLVVTNNVGLNNVIPSVASTSALALPLNPTIRLTGTTTVTSITGAAWTGRQVTMIPDGIVSFTAGNNIANSITTSAGKTVVGTYSGTSWSLQ